MADRREPDRRLSAASAQGGGRATRRAGREGGSTVTDTALAERAKAERFRHAAQLLREWTDELRDDDNRLLTEGAEEEEQDEDELAT